MSLTIAHVSCRRDSKLEWFLDSLANQCGGESVNLIIVDFYADDPERRKEILLKLSRFPQFQFKITPPKPTVWQGKYRLTKENWFAAASMRNTAICLCETTHIAFCDDLAVLQGGWWNAAKEACELNDTITCGAYAKVRQLTVETGVAIAYEVNPHGEDDRLKRVYQDVSPCNGGWLFGCSFVAPMECLLTVGAFPEFMDGLGAEDYTLGMVLQNAGFKLRYDRRMMTLESEELHYVETPMKRADKGVSPNDKSHAALHLAQQSKYFPNYYEGGIRKLRQDILSGIPFPTSQTPDRDWYDGQLISEL